MDKRNILLTHPGFSSGIQNDWVTHLIFSGINYTDLHINYSIIKLDGIAINYQGIALYSGVYCD